MYPKIKDSDVIDALDFNLKQGFITEDDYYEQLKYFSYEGDDDDF